MKWEGQSLSGRRGSSPGTALGRCSEGVGKCSQNPRMVGVGRDLCGSPRAGCTSLQLVAGVRFLYVEFFIGNAQLYLHFK